MERQEAPVLEWVKRSQELGSGHMFEMPIEQPEEGAQPELAFS
jgi:hypothetical protein